MPTVNRVIFVLSLLLIAPAGVSAENLEFCLKGLEAQRTGKSPTQAIDYYTRCLTQGALTTENLASAYNKRGIAYTNAHQYDRAIADFAEAISLTPAYADAYFNRGNAYSRKRQIKRAIADFSQSIRLRPNEIDAYILRGTAYADSGQFDQAIADYSAVIRLKPDHAGAYESRGQNFFYNGQFARAVSDLRQSLAIAPKNYYAALWLYLSQTRAKDNSARQMLLQSARKLELSKWPAPIIRHYLGEVSAQQLFDQAKDSDSGKYRAQLCEAYFYLGQTSLIGGNLRSAEDLFDRAIAQCPGYLVGSTAAKVEKARLRR